MGELIIPESQELVSKELNNQILAVLSNNADGFQKAYVMAQAIKTLKEKLTPEFMAPIMELQGSKLGFKTDKDLVKDNQTGKYKKGPGYPEEVVKSCLIEMVLIGLQPTGNEFNIIGGNSYITKEGGTSLIKKQQGLTNVVITYPSYSQSSDKKTANVKANIKWEYNGKKEEETVDFPIKSDAYTTFDALIGKAERKAKVWLYNSINGTNFSDGDITEIPHEVIKTTINPEQVASDKERERVIEHIEKSTSLDVLKRCSKAIKDDDHELLVMYDDKKKDLEAANKK